MDNVQKIIEKQAAEHTESPVEKVYTTEQTEDLGQIEDVVDKSTQDELKRVAKQTSSRAGATSKQRATPQPEPAQKIGKASGRVDFEASDEPLPFDEPAQVVRHAEGETAEARDGKRLDRETEEPGEVAEEDVDKDNIKHGLGYYVGGTFHIAAKVFRPKSVSLLTFPFRVTSDVLESAAELIESSRRVQTLSHLVSDAITYPLRLGRELIRHAGSAK